MDTIREIHIKNLKEAIRKLGKLDHILDRIDQIGEPPVSKKYLQNVINGVISKGSTRPRDIGPAVCRKIEKALDKPVGWMDVNRDEVSDLSGIEKALLNAFRMMTESQQRILTDQAEQVRRENEEIVEYLRAKNKKTL